MSDYSDLTFGTFTARYATPEWYELMGEPVAALRAHIDKGLIEAYSHKGCEVTTDE